MRARSLVCSLVMLLALYAPGVVAARGVPVMLRMEAFAGDKPEGVHADAEWRVTLRGEATRLTVTKLRVVTGGLAYYQVVSALSPYPNAFTLMGDAAMLDRIAASTSARPVVIVGALTMGPGARVLQVNSVDQKKD